MLRTKQRNLSFFIRSAITFLMTEICQYWLFITDEVHPSTPTPTICMPTRVCPHGRKRTHTHIHTHTHTHTQTHGYLFHFVGSLFFGFKHWSNRKTVKTESLTLKLNWTELILKFKMLQASEYRLFCTIHLVGSLQLLSKALFILMNI